MSTVGRTDLLFNFSCQSLRGCMHALHGCESLIQRNPLAHQYQLYRGLQKIIKPINLTSGAAFNLIIRLHFYCVNVVKLFIFEPLKISIFASRGDL